MSDAQTDSTEEAPDLVHARYLGETEIVVPSLAGRPRCCIAENQAPHAGENVSMAFLASEPDEDGVQGLVHHAIDAHAVVRHGDVILLDRYSAEQRSDFEVVGTDGKTPTRADLLAQAEARGIAVPPKATKDQIAALLDAHAGDADADTEQEA
jgi:hypothetical protein